MNNTFFHSLNVFKDNKRITNHPTLTNGLLSYYSMSNGSGTILTDVHGNNNGTLVNGPTWTTGKIGGGLEFDGVNDNVNFGNIFNFSSTANFSIASWIYYTGDTGYILGKFAPGISGQWRFFTSSNNIFGLSREVFPFSLNSSAVLNLNQWNFIVGTYNGTSMRIYHNGTLVGGPQNSGSVASNTRSVRMGSNDNNGGHYTGKIDETGIWNRALTQSEITDLYNSNNGLPYN